MLDKY